MISEELEKLIQSSVEDGVITDLERKVLVKRAQKENVDLDELNVYIEGLLQKKQKENQAAAPQENKREQYHGKVIKCPSCNEPIEAGLAVCPSCGYEFHGVEANKSVKELSKQLDELLKREYTGENAGDKKAEAIATAITSFPIPPTKDDFIEFIHFLKTGFVNPPLCDTLSGTIAKAYRGKINECFDRAKISFPNDKIIQGLQQDLQVAFEKRDKENIIAIIGCLGIPAILFFLFILLGLLGCFD